MNKLYSAVSFLVVLVVGVISSAAADGWRTGLSATYPGVSFNDVHYVNATTAWAVGSKGVVLKTTDGGATWVSSANDTLGNLASVYFRTATEGYIGSSSRKLYKTTDGGTTWSRLVLNATLPDTGAVLRARNFSDASKGWVLRTISSTNGRILRTTDGGATWVQDLVVGTGFMLRVAGRRC